MDALTDIIGLLRPQTVLTGSMSASGRWGVRVPPQPGPTFYFVMEGCCWCGIGDDRPFELRRGDCVLSARPERDTFRSDPDVPVVLSDDAFKERHRVDGEFRIGDATAPPACRIVGGLIVCDPANADLLVGLLPRLIQVRGEDDVGERLRWLVGTIGEETGAARAGREAVLSRLIEILLIELLRREAASLSPHVGVLAGLADPRLAKALALIHGDVGRGWTVAELAGRAGMSRSVFARRFAEAVGVAPVEYLLDWRMALAKDALLRGDGSMEEIAEAVGYRSASAFSTAFAARVGGPPSRYAGAVRAGAAR
ncbi:AraC family transcriptional regulator [Mesorhizobium marinum]|uniref:AraC family transcriptional regulator n=1 Tax=Mesorhizobium marinum TaxID=3228790 RepID=UPI0034679DC5